jgi:type IV pilus assembly protein PilB
MANEAPPIRVLAPVGTAGPTTASRVGELVGAAGLLTREQVAAVVERAGEGSFAHALIDENLSSDKGVARSLARRCHLPLVDLAETTVSAAASGLVPVRVLERVEAVPYAVDEGLLKVAVADPRNLQGIDELRLSTRYRLELSVAPRDDILVEVQRLARSAEAHAVGFEELDVDEGPPGDFDLEDGISEAPLVRLVNAIVFQAAEEGASDVHFEPSQDALLVRFRVDGVLREAQRIPRSVANGVITRLKVLAKLDIAERRVPQDGRISLSAAAAGRVLDIRVATLPTVEGESVVMRLLDKSREAPTLTQLGLSESMREQLAEILTRPTGALLVTGPTGSGKSTTLYAALAQIHRPELKTITVEDPVEYRLAGINQMQINPKAGLTFAGALRTILRADPDVIMVGEIRDVETAKIAIEAALTGHFVLSTLHTNDAPSALTRLNEMGVEPFLTGSAVSAVLAQRLARRLCTNCRELYEPTVDELIQARVPPEVATESRSRPLYRKVGCARCNKTGYRGRISIVQLMLMSEELERLGVARASRDELERAAIAGGMRRLWDDGLEKVDEGITSLEELGRVLA